MDSGYGTLIRVASEILALNGFLSGDPDDYDRKSMSTIKLSKIMSKHYDNLRRYAILIRESADKQEKENKKLRTAIINTLDENRHLADGDVCTLIELKNAVRTDLKSQKQDGKNGTNHKRRNNKTP